LPLLHLEQISANNYQLSTSMSELNYKSAGVNYEPLDAFKRLCQSAAAGTRSSLKFHGLTEPAKVRGESAYLLEGPDSYLAHVEEGLGTKNLVADAMRQLTDQCYYRAIGIDTVATMVNDLITCGALPVMIAMHAGVGDADWFADSVRAKNLADGFAEGCRQSRAVWAGGETPALKGIISPDAIVLAGSAVGGIAPKENRIAGDVANGDAIILLASSGVQTNGLTLCRALAERLSNGYLTPIDDGRPSVNYLCLLHRRLPAGESQIALRRPPHRPRLAKADAIGREFYLSNDRHRPRPADLSLHSTSVENVG
jgi:phosphoribosylformylglycinamidine cyclo-ligase